MWSFIVLSITMWTSGIDWRVLPSALAIQLIETVAEVLYLACAEDASHTHQLTLRVSSWPSEDMPTFTEMFPVLIGRCVLICIAGGPLCRRALQTARRSLAQHSKLLKEWWWFPWHYHPVFLEASRVCWENSIWWEKENCLVDHRWSTRMHCPDLFKYIIQTFT